MMSGILVKPPFEVFADTAGQPLDAGYIYIGAPFQNPEVAPVLVYWDSALTIPAAQPIRTTGGYPSRSGTPAKIYIQQATYSILVRDKRRKFVYSDLEAVSTDDLGQQLANPDQGTNLIGDKTSRAGGVGRVLRDVLDDMYVNIKDFGARANISDNSPFIRAAWLAAPEGATLYIPAEQFPIGTSLRLPTKGVNIRCDGSILVAAGTWDGVVFDGAPDFTLPGTALTSVVNGGTKLNFVGSPPVSDPQNYFFDIETTEVYVNRVTQADYVPYTKNEAHSIESYDWQISDPFIYTHVALSLATLHLTKKTKPTIVDRLTVIAAQDADITFRNLFRVINQSNIVFNDLQLDSTLANRFGIGLGHLKSHNITFNRPVIKGYNITGIQGDISYPSAGSISSYVYYNNYRLGQVQDPGGSKRPRGSIDHYCNQMFFNNCQLVGGLDCHIGSNYFVMGGALSQEGFAFAGTNATMDGVKCYGTGGDMALFAVRGDAPYCQGKLTLRNCDIPGEWLLIYGATALTGDPLGRTSKFKLFDEIEIDNIRIRGGLQTFDSVINLAGVRNTTVFPVVEGTDKVRILNVESLNTMASISQVFLRLGDAAITVAASPTFIISELVVENLDLPLGGRFAGATYQGDIKFGPCAIDSMVINDSIGISLHNIRGVTRLEVQTCRTNNKAEFFFEKFNNVDAIIVNTELNIAINAAALTPVGAPKFTLLNNTFNAIGQVQNGSIARGNGNAVLIALTIPSFYTGKLNNYLDATVYKTS